MGKAKKLRGCSKIALPDGTLHDVRDGEGKRVMPAEEWKRYEAQLGAQIRQAASDAVAAQPGLGPALGLSSKERERAVTVLEMLGMS